MSESSVFTLPDGVQDEQAVFLTIAQIVLNGVRRAGVQLGQSVAVYGLGLLGQLTVRFCRRCGARPVAAIDVAEPRIELLPKDSGIVHINARQCDVLSTLREVTGGQLCDIVFEVTGRADQLAAECKAVRRQGKFVILSSPSGASSFDFHDLCNAPSVTIIGAHVSSAPREESPDNPWSGRRNAQTFFNCLLDGELDLQRLISHRSPFTEAPQLYRSLLADRSTAMGVVIEWSKLPKGNAT